MSLRPSRHSCLIPPFTPYSERAFFRHLRLIRHSRSSATYALFGTRVFSAIYASCDTRVLFRHLSLSVIRDSYITCVFRTARPGSCPRAMHFLRTSCHPSAHAPFARRLPGIQVLSTDSAPEGSTQIHSTASPATAKPHNSLSALYGNQPSRNAPEAFSGRSASSWQSDRKPFRNRTVLRDCTPWLPDAVHTQLSGPPGAQSRLTVWTAPRQGIGPSTLTTSS